GLECFRGDTTLCDVILVAGDASETFPVHREMGEIKLHGVTRVGLKNIIDFIYTSRVNLNMANLQDTLEAANFLQVMPVLGFCNQLLSSEVTVDNCVEVERVATDLLLEDVLENIGSGRYLELSASTLAQALASDSLKGFSEMELYGIARAWIRHDAPARRASLYALMRHIRFPLMTPGQLLRISQGGAEDEQEEDADGWGQGDGAKGGEEEEEEAALMRGDAACVSLLLEASNYQMMPFLQPALQTERTRIRSDATHLLALGGVMRQQLVVSRELRLYDGQNGLWRALEPMVIPRYQHGVALLGGFLFIVGGQSTYDTKGKTALDCAVECYNLKRNEWTFVSHMSEPHYGHAGSVHGDYMYVS
ncbi:hypothetical protein CRUP_002697, partial [Coryphaenoides rupestris]